MLYKIDTEVGAIKIRKAVISKIVLESIKSLKDVFSLRIIKENDSS